MPGGCSLFSRSRRASLSFCQTYNYEVDHEYAPPVALPLAFAPTPSTFHIPLRAHDGLFAQPTTGAADDAVFDRPRFNDDESHRRRVVVDVASGREGRGAGAIKHRGSPLRLDAVVGVLLEMFGLVGWVYVLTCTHTFWLYQH